MKALRVENHGICIRGTKRKSDVRKRQREREREERNVVSCIELDEERINIFSCIFAWDNTKNTWYQECISRHRSTLSQYAFYFTRQSASQKWLTLIMSIFLTKRIISSLLQNAKITWYCGQETDGVTRKASKVPAMSDEYWFSIVGYGNRIVKTLYFKVSPHTERNITNCWRYVIITYALVYDRWQ